MSGTSDVIVASQLGTVPRIENCLAIDMMVAVRIMHLTWLSRTHPTLPCTVYFADNQWKALSCFLTRKPVPQDQTGVRHQAEIRVASS